MTRYTGPGSVGNALRQASPVPPHVPLPPMPAPHPVMPPAAEHDHPDIGARLDDLEHRVTELEQGEAGEAAGP